MSQKKGRFIHRLIQRLRIASQVLFFCLFLYLLLGTHYSGTDYIGPVESFFHFDPLLGLATLLSSKTLLKAFCWALATVVLTALFGRYVCGWACPFGAVLQLFSHLSRKINRDTPKPAGSGLLQLKYAILSATLAAALFGLNFTGFLDPLAFLYRSLALIVLPPMALSAEAAARVFPGIGLGGLGDGLDEALRSLTINTTYSQGLVIGLIFLAVVLLNVRRERFWCRYLCPAGALLAILSRWNLVKVRIDRDKCTQCGVCSLHCQTQATPFPNKDWQPSECVYCYRCAVECPTRAISFPLSTGVAGTKPVDIPRRKWILSGIFGLALIPLFRSSASARRASSKLIRPPGSLPEPEFLASCIRCGACMKVCPTNALQPASNQAGPEGLWTPVLVPRMGYCEYYCSLCTQVCPTGAIKELKIAEKTKIRIGTAWIDKNRCIPYALGRSCTVCEEKCPTSPKAIKLVETESEMPDGTWAGLEIPVVELDLCIGCGICETRCPVNDAPAIYCTSLGEARAGESSFMDQIGG